ncbi:MAG TPA: MFS transporter [Gemmatimonadales bacterium]|nr:MFS transporter [Gemmatimonadales bacterium]
MTRTVRLGLAANWRQFWLLVLVNAFVGAMVGLERHVLPLLAEVEFGIASRTAILSFIASFGVAKALSNLAAGRIGDVWGRKRVLVAGWLVGLPVPFLVMWAPAWSWIVVANVLLGVNQGLCWSTTVIMKIDLAGPARRGLATGLNEFAGYLAVALAAFASGVVAEQYGLRPEPFYLGVAFVAAGLGLSSLIVRDTGAHVAMEAAGLRLPVPPVAAPSFVEVFRRTSYRDRALSSCSQAGLVNNLNDGVAWGLFPLLFAGQGLSVKSIGLLAALYPAAWGVCQPWTGALSDHLGRKWLIAGGMLLQGAALVAVVTTAGLYQWGVALLALGVGTAMVYPTLLAAVGDVAHPSWRGSAVGVYRLWRDSGYAVGALAGGAAADMFSLETAVWVTGAVTVLSGLWVATWMPETLAKQR